MNTVKYYAILKYESGLEVQCNIIPGDEETEKVIKALDNGTVLQNEVWCYYYSFSNSGTLLANVRHFDDHAMYKTGYLKVISLRKEVIGIIEEKQIF